MNRDYFDSFDLLMSLCYIYIRGNYGKEGVYPIVLKDINLDDDNLSIIGTLENLGLIVDTGNGYQLTEKGVEILNKSRQLIDLEVENF